MGLSGSQVAYRWAIADEEPRGKTRADTTRAGHFLRNAIPVWINGAARRGLVQSSLRIDVNTGAEPHRCTFAFKGGSGFVPSVGHEITIGHGSTDNPLFAGRIVKATRTVLRHVETKPTYTCEALGWVFDLNTTRVVKAFHAQSLSVSSVVRGLLAATSPLASTYGFSAHIAADLPSVENITAGPDEKVSEVLARVCRAADVQWHVDHKKRVRVFGLTDPIPGADISTLTASNSMFWGLTYDATDLTRVYAVVVVHGAAQPSLADVETDYHRAIPLASASLLGNFVTTSGYDDNLNSSAQHRVDVEYVLDAGTQTPESLFRGKGQVSVFLPTTVNANTLVVVGVNVSSAAPIRDQRWYQISGNYVYVSSAIGVYSMTANTIGYYYHVPSSRSGNLQSDIPALEPIAGLWNFKIDNTMNIPFFPAGTRVQNYAWGTNAIDPGISSLFGSQSFRNIAKVITDERLTPLSCIAVRDEALNRGTPDAWKSLTFETRDPHVELGRTVYVSLTSPGEASGPSIVSSFTVQDVTIGDFGRLTETLGPVRSVRAGAVRRPTLWQVLQGDR